MQVTPHQTVNFDQNTPKTGAQKSAWWKQATADLLSRPTDNQPYPGELQNGKTTWHFGDLNHRDDREEPFFVDWLTMRQSHLYDLPEVNCGVVFSVDTHGEVEWTTQRPSKIEGSFETSVQVRCDGRTVMFSGNVSRFGRTDNLWGYSFGQCITRINNILQRLGLPPFTAGQKFYRQVRHQDGHCTLRPAWTGATISRVDMTANFETGCLSDARAYLAWLSTQQGNSRLKVGTHPDGETVDWGKGSRRIYSKVYLKSAEMKKHGGPQELIDYCEQVGLVRFEVTAKATQLIAMGCNHLGGFDMKQMEMLFNERAAVLTRAEHTQDDLAELPNAIRRTARDYLAGDDLLDNMSERTFRRHRNAILPYGIDISVPRNVVNFQPRIRVIELKPASVPSWYQLNERLAA